ncbi:hypothetical protein [Methanoculleus frigidifontis]|uniref:hypothetical protein n=1 Tax=Methanoculleus frigidifontis TaxID=2584085 RepID=UPI002659E875|nr:hypothetical protein [Methanoculleus sp. FWC-SCC1]
MKAYLVEQEKRQGLRVWQGEARRRPWLALTLEKIRLCEHPKKGVSQNRGVKSALTRTSDYLKGTRGVSGAFTVRSSV